MTPPEALLLLLCCPLGQGVKPFTLWEFQDLSALVTSHERGENRELTEDSLMELGLPPALCRRIAVLANREEQLAAYLRAQPEIIPVTRISPAFPRQLRKLGKHCPAALFCRGDLALLQRPCVSLVGSRDLGERGRAFARHMGRLAAQEGYTLVSGNARGADREAQEACLAEGGSVIAFVATPLVDLPLRERVLYCCLDGYEFPFSTYRALARNHPIHAMGRLVFVAQCPETRGGTWEGAYHNLRHGLSPVFVPADGTPGIQALIRLGAVPLEENPGSIGRLGLSQLSIFD